MNHNNHNRQNHKNHQPKPTIHQRLACLVALGVGAFAMSGCSQSQPTHQPSTHAIKVSQAATHTTSTPKQITILHSDHDEHNHSHEIPRNVGTKADFDAWLKSHPYAVPQVQAYERYLSSQLGANRIPPMHELLTTARSWQECGYEPYEVPPQALWSAMLPTIRLFNELRAADILPANTHIRSVYRSPDLNRCAGGAPSSKHMTNGAMDIWVPNFEVGSHELFQLQNRLCEFWLFHGKSHEFGLGLYATGAIHLDTQGYRKWGAQFSETHSVCRITPAKS